MNTVIMLFGYDNEYGHQAIEEFYGESDIVSFTLFIFNRYRPGSMEVGYKKN